MATLLTLIKAQIKANLDELKVAGTLGEVVYDDYKLGILDRDYGAYPVAILQTASLQGGYLTNTQNIRTYTYQIVILQRAENVASATDIEHLMEDVINKFDSDITLSGTADGGVEPSSSVPEPVTSRGKSFIALSIFIKAKAVKDI